ncbi:hypothetical protein AMECASPLE_022658 [Ameca splendens]|uniref:Uncharacterized protein n=1 Tax=Ameca splendens TaxID=208324 RepID=A0ABV0Z1X2_9TELE
MEPSGPEPDQFEPLAQGADSVMSEAHAAKAVEEQFQLLTRNGGVSDLSGRKKKKNKSGWIQFYIRRGIHVTTPVTASDFLMLRPRPG